MVRLESLSAEGQAESLLLQHLNPEQQERYKAEGWFEFEGSRGGKFRLYRKDALVRRGCYGDGRMVWLPAMPMGDEMAYLAHNVWVTDRSHQGYAPEAAILLSFKTLVEVDQNRAGIGCTCHHYAKLLDGPVYP